ncbi:DUF1294 domain-containing protein [Roseimicrobium gellanilyticum]|nr:DUF1294 domain-containing protein [Roseimicrobium gellanilyticum]
MGAYRADHARPSTIYNHCTEPENMALDAPGTPYLVAHMTGSKSGRLTSSLLQLVRTRTALMVFLLVLPSLAAWRRGSDVWLGLMVFMMLFSMAAYGLYWHDKRRAQANGWRLPETTLHAFSLLGGWPGAYIAQQHLRHKTAKRWFQVVYWVIVLLWQIVSLALLV